MEDDIEATQPATQEPLERPLAPPDPDTLIILHPASPAANRAIDFLAHRYPAFVRNHVESSLPGYILLTSKTVPKNPEACYTFGRNPIKCDVALGQQSPSRRVSNVHFRIFTTDDGVIMLEDCSTNGTWVDGHCLQSPRAVNNRGPGGPPATEEADGAPPSRRRILTNGSLILLALGPVDDELKFIVDLKHTNNRAWDEVRARHRPGGRDAMAPPGRRVQAGQGYGNDAASEQYPFPDGWAGDNGIYEVGPLIGKGAFAIVRKVTERSTGELFAVKIINKRVFGPPEENGGKKNGRARYLGVLKEVEIMEQLKHPNIVHFQEYKETPRQLYIRMEFLAHGDLGKWIGGEDVLSEEHVRTVTQQINNALVFIHNLNISHRDIKPDNILVKSHNPLIVKLSDFGLAKMIQEDSFNKTFCGTMLYLAPEVFPTVVGVQNPVTRNVKYHKENKRYNHVCDMWSLGCVVYALLTGCPPFQGQSQEEIQGKIMAARYDKTRMTRGGITPNAINLVERFLVTDPTKRMTEKQALRHAWLENGTSELECSQGGISQYIDEDEEEQLSQNIEVWEEVKGRLEAHDPEDSRDEDVDVHDLVETRKPEQEDADGDVEIENSQEQVQRIEREEEELGLLSTPIRGSGDIRSADSLERTVRPFTRRMPRDSLEGHRRSSYDGAYEDSDDHSDLAGLSEYADDRVDDVEASSFNGAYAESSGVFGNSRYAPLEPSEEEDEEEDELSRFGAQPAGRVRRSLNSSRADDSDLDSSFILVRSPTEKKTRRRRKQTPGQDGKSLAGMGTMVRNLNVGSITGNSEDVLRRKGSGRLSTDDRISKRASSSSLRRKSASIEPPTFLSRAPLENQMSDIPSEGSNPNGTPSQPHQPEVFPESMNAADATTLAGDSMPRLAAEDDEDAEGEENEDEEETRPKTIWGRVSPIEGSIPHESINLLDRHVRYGRSSASVLPVTDTRVSKHHFILLLGSEEEMLTPPDQLDIEQSFRPRQDMKAWIRVLGSNGLILSGRKLKKDEFFRVFDRDIIMVFKDKHDFLGLRVDLMVGTHKKTAADWQMEKELDEYRASEAEKMLLAAREATQKEEEEEVRLRLEKERAEAALQADTGLLFFDDMDLDMANA